MHDLIPARTGQGPGVLDVHWQPAGARPARTLCGRDVWSTPDGPLEVTCRSCMRAAADPARRAVARLVAAAERVLHARQDRLAGNGVGLDRELAELLLALEALPAGLHRLDPRLAELAEDVRRG